MGPQLKDIHNPAAISIWPLAPGWYIVIALSVVLIVAMVLIVWRWHKKRYLPRTIMSEWQKISDDYQTNNNSSATIQALNQLLRQVSLSKLPRESVAGLYGDDWLKFLDATSGGNQFSRGPGRYLVEQAYQKNSESDLTELLQITKTWLKQSNKNKKRWRGLSHV